MRPKPAKSAVVKPDRETRACQDFLLGAKLFWTRRLYRELQVEYLEKVRERGGREPASFEEAERMMESSATYQFFGWFERHLQRLKYSGPHGIVGAVERQREELEGALGEAAALPDEHLRLDPSIEMPRYFTAVDFHQHPGGVAGDELAGFVYEYGRKTTTPNHIHEDDLHRRLAEACPRGNYRRILDFGCGIGKSTYPFRDLYPEAEVHGVDISAPCLKLAHLRAGESGREIFYSQQNLERTDFPDGYFDLIHTTFIQHELPPAALAKVTAEAYRLLAPGGYYVNLDFHSAPGGMFGRLMHFGHARRNNEVFMRSFHESDYEGLLRKVGFGEVEMRPFDDGTGPITNPETLPANWRFPWQLFVSRKTEGKEKN